jgi:hypothetical protein
MNGDGFDPDAPAVVVYSVLDSECPDAVCTWMWRGPSADWAVVGEVVRQGPALVLRSLRLLPYGAVDASGDEEDPAVPPAGTISPAMLKRIPLGRLLAQVNAELSSRRAAYDQGEYARDPLLAGRPEQWREHIAATDVAERPRRGRPPLPDDLLRRVALGYIEDAQLGPGVTRRLAQAFGVQPNTMRDYIRAARKREWLAPGAPGSRSAAPGLRLLDEVRSSPAYRNWPLPGEDES